MDPAQALTRKIKDCAHQLGFELVGVSMPERPPHYEVYSSWLAAGRHGALHYLETERARKRRENPAEILPGCQSILSLGMRYWNQLDYSDQTKKQGRIAGYALGDDYHEVLSEHLTALQTEINTLAGRPIASRAYTDTGPILERDLAMQAGLGWIGKNTCLIHPRHGSYFFLAELFLDIALTPDPPFQTDHCGTCTRCLEACPTQCILPDRTLDAQRCISYLAIELKGPIPTAQRATLGNWIFGCDICQEVCPWNQRFAVNAPVDPAFVPRPDLLAIDLAAEIGLSAEEFRQKFKNNPVKRAKYRGYLRNACIALGNTGSAEDIVRLSAALRQHPEALVRQSAAWAIGQIGGEAGYAALAAASEAESDRDVRGEIQAALEKIGNT